MPYKKQIVCMMTSFLFLLLAGCGAGWSFGTPDLRPNFLIIVTDDQRLDTMQYMPHTLDLIFDQGVTFANGFVTTPLCCPSRASILTGLYARNHGVRENDTELTQATFIHTLKENGYRTALVGKYLNSWKGDALPEYDYWVSFQYGETRYNNPRLNVNGEWIRHEGEYVTYALGDYAIEFINSSAGRNKPFALLLTFNAPHDPATPAKEDKFLPLDLPPRLPSFNAQDVSDKPAWVDIRESLLTEEAIKEIDAFRRGQILSLYSLDRTIEKVLSALNAAGEMDNTVIIFLSDNGRHWGEHRLVAKNTVYEESIHVPFAIRYPPLVPQAYREDKIVANIDIMPTVYELAGIPIPSDLDGYSLVSLLKDPATDWREGVLIEGWPPRGSYIAIRTERYLYAETVHDFYAPSADPQLELYDLELDPYELNNVVDDPGYHQILINLRSLLQAEQERVSRNP